MGLLSRLHRSPAAPSGPPRFDLPRALDTRSQQVSIYGGHETLEVVGESHYQRALWQIVGDEFAPRDPVRHEVVALPVPEPDNPYDAKRCSDRR
jgi:hypothetical protein